MSSVPGNTVGEQGERVQHIVLLSGVGSWAAGKRVAERYGTADITCLFTDTRSEDDDTYAFVRAAAANIGGELAWVADGRNIWEVFHDHRFIGNTRADVCSKVLKRDVRARWLAEHCDPAHTVVYIGIGWDEIHRMEGTPDKPGFRQRMAAKGWRAEAPLLDPPCPAKLELLEWAEKEGLPIPELYRRKFPHANCSGFCVKAGQAHFRHLLREFPERYAYHEAQEQSLREHLGKDVAILRDRRGGQTTPLTLLRFREQLESSAGAQCDLFDWGGCGCAIDE